MDPISKHECWLQEKSCPFLFSLFTNILIVRRLYVNVDLPDPIVNVDVGQPISN